MKQPIFLLALILVLISISGSQVSTYYYISFDKALASNDYSLTASGPDEYQSPDGNMANEYKVKISSRTKPQIILIYLFIFDDYQILLPAEVLEQRIRNDILDDATDVQTTTSIIDNSQGAIASYNLAFAGLPQRIYGAIYQPSPDQGLSMVYIYSSFPWDEGTSQLLKTIHVERANVGNANGNEVPGQGAKTPLVLGSVPGRSTVESSTAIGYTSFGSTYTGSGSTEFTFTGSAPASSQGSYNPEGGMYGGCYTNEYGEIVCVDSIGQASGSLGVSQGKTQGGCYQDPVTGEITCVDYYGEPSDA